jgi:hypothetical protein
MLVNSAETIVDRMMDGLGTDVYDETDYDGEEHTPAITEDTYTPASILPNSGKTGRDIA